MELNDVKRREFLKHLGKAFVRDIFLYAMWVAGALLFSDTYSNMSPEAYPGIFWPMIGAVTTRLEGAVAVAVMCIVSWLLWRMDRRGTSFFRMLMRSLTE